MEVEINSNQVNIRGNIKSVSDLQTLKQNLDELARTHNTITLNILDSMSITSSVIGYLTKLVLKDKIAISMHVSNAQLIELLEELDLVQTFNVKKV